MRTGIGDFQGLTRRLDYLSGLGVTTVWLMPFQPTPFRDDGYDIADYYGGPALRHDWRFCRIHPRGEATRHAGADRSCRQPHIE
jgi:Alpha amylase, catalytic domain